MSLNIIQQFMKGMVKIHFGLLKIQVKFLKKLKSRGFLASSLSTYDSPSLYTTLPHNLIKVKLTELIEHSCNNKIAFLFLLLNNLDDISCGHVRKCVMLSIIFCHSIFIRFGSKLYRQIVGIQMGTNFAPLDADLFCFCYEKDFMLSLSDNNQTDIIEALNLPPDIKMTYLILIILILSKFI